MCVCMCGVCDVGGGVCGVCGGVVCVEGVVCVCVECVVCVGGRLKAINLCQQLVTTIPL